MNHYATSLKRSFWQRINKPRLPAAYQAGLTLNKLERNLQPYPCEWADSGELLVYPEGELVVRVSERVKTLFMAFIVYTRFSIAGTISQPLNADIQVKTGGTLRKKQIRFVSQQKEGMALIAQLENYPIIRQTLEELDFRLCSLKITDGKWHCEIEHFAASEMVSRIPATRRYLRLTSQQRHRLLSALHLIDQLMKKLFQQ
ncbi:hypothetical protein Xmau_02921 [Xenorhabdus mauleonii]|uniref:DUF3156 domain-containing protein n=1 Tax=Xenorhabdus mauleonii TaxID=351675 RepID=A0A1I3TBP5_9GAMM|nr:DUF3156 family protein [Xenorhabdus mauleonii]PHM39314.1 hypothetical protein Xmau_02921 [Xenorhabdus mauleonii]SFJ67953.1 Protein of unknown function [Xenorhabdus mauleonii]